MVMSEEVVLESTRHADWLHRQRDWPNETGKDPTLMQHPVVSHRSANRTDRNSSDAHPTTEQETRQRAEINFVYLRLMIQLGVSRQLETSAEICQVSIRHILLSWYFPFHGLPHRVAALVDRSVSSTLVDLLTVFPNQALPAPWPSTNRYQYQFAAIL